MPTASTSYSGGILTTNFDYAKLFLGNNRWIQADYTNGSGSDVTIANGTLMGRIFATGKVTKHVSSATNGSQIPLGFVSTGETSMVVADGVTVTLNICVSGQINVAGITLGGSDTVATVILFNSSVPAATTTQAGRIDDLLVKQGFELMTIAQNSLYDN